VAGAVFAVQQYRFACCEAFVPPGDES